MIEQTLADMEARMRRLERQNRIQGRALIALLCVALAVGSVAVSNAQPSVLTAQEVRAHRFTLLDPNGGVAADWFTLPSRRDGDMIHGGSSYSGWPQSRP